MNSRFWGDMGSFLADAPVGAMGGPVTIPSDGWHLLTLVGQDWFAHLFPSLRSVMLVA